MNKLFPLDFKKLIKLGGINFLKQNSNWPVDGKTFYKLSNIYFKNFVKNTNKLPDIKKKVIFTDYTFAFHIMQRAHMLLAIEILKKKNIKTLSSKNSNQFFFNNKNLSVINFENKKNRFSIIYFKIKKILINLYLKKNYFINRPTFLDFGGTSEAKINYAKKNKINIIKDYDFFYLKNFEKNSYTDEKNYYRNFVNETILFYENSIFKYFNIKINLQSLRKIWKNRLIQIENFVKNKIDQSNNFEGVLIENTSSISSRILACVFNEQNKKVYGFDHGNITHSSYYIFNSLDTILYNNFITISKNSKKSLEKIIIKTFDSKILKKIKIVNFNNNSKLKKKFLINSKKMQHQTIKKIMIMGWPMNSRIYCQHAGYFFYNKLNFEIELIEILKKNGFYVVYKPHPERIEGICKFFKNLVDEIVYEKFDNEKVQDKADAYIFSYMGSSAMAHALCTNKQVFLLDHITKNFHKEHLKTLKKRVNIIDCRFTNKYQLDEKKIISKINYPIKNISFEYVKNFLF